MSLNPQSYFRLDGRVALITGSCQGLGRAIAETFAQAGASLVVTSRDEGKARETADELTRDCGGPCVGYRLDVREAESVTSAVEGIEADLGRLDILVNNAGISHRGPILSLGESQWDDVIETNLKGAWLCSQAAHPLMQRGGWGRILNVASMFSTVALPNRSPYVASKGGMTALTRALAIEFASDNILVNALAPGPFQTDMADEKAREKLLEAIPLGRWGQPQELGPAALFLCSEAASYITGTTLAIDGGYTAR